MTDREYISVLFQEKDDAKSLGAKWDGEKRQWYIPENINKINKLKLQENLKPVKCLDLHFKCISIV